jgi:hypothetical protein
MNGHAIATGLFGGSRMPRFQLHVRRWLLSVRRLQFVEASCAPNYSKSKISSTANLVVLASFWMLRDLTFDVACRLLRS